MIHKSLNIGRWLVDFVFCDDNYDEEEVLTLLYDADAPFYVLKRVSEIMRSGESNTGFTYTNPSLLQAVVVIGPSSSGKEFINTVTHEVHHLAVAVAANLGIDLEGEAPAYIAGESAREIAGIICEMGCR